MVSIRRRRLLGLNPYPGQSFFGPPENLGKDTRPASVYHMPSVDPDQPKDNNISKIGNGSSDVSASSSSKEQPIPVQVKHRKRHKRKHSVNQEQCVMRGVYLKNMKWQAAIKVHKKQIHLGTVGSQEEAAHLYDRAAFMCGRETNSELSEDEKQELSKYTWDEFLEMTRSAITSKKQQRRNGAAFQRKAEPAMQDGDVEGEQGVDGSSALEYAELEPETSVA